METAIIYRLVIKGFRGLKWLNWSPAPGINIILGGGDAGKSTILDAIALLLHPSYSAPVADTDFNGRIVEDGFTIEATMKLPSQCGVHDQSRPIWPWHWDGGSAVVPSDSTDGCVTPNPVFRFRVRGTADFDLLHETVQPDGTIDHFPVGLRRKIGLVRLAGDDRNDRDLRLVQGSALDRLLVDKGLRSRLSIKLAQADVNSALSEAARKSIATLDTAFEKKKLPHGLDVGLVGSAGASIAAMIGLTAKSDAAELPLTSWGAGTRRLSALAIAETDSPITLVDEVERGLEPYRQRVLMQALQNGPSQVFTTTHSPAVIAAATEAHFWYIDHAHSIGPLDAKKIKRQRQCDPETFLARLAIVAEGKTEVGLVIAILEDAFKGPLSPHGIHVCDGGGHENALDLLDSLSEGGLKFGGFVDEEAGKHPTRWSKIATKQGPLLFRWKSGCTEQNIINAVPESHFEALITDPNGLRTGSRLRSLADRIGVVDKSFKAIETKAGESLRNYILDAALGAVPAATAEEEMKALKSHAQQWFKSIDGGRELAGKLFSLGIWKCFRPQFLPFCNAVRQAVGLPEVEDLAP